MSALKLGSLFSGYGGLDQAVHAAFGDVETAWVSDFDTGPNKILAHRYPTVPNLGDITRIDWTKVEPVDIIAGGFPCQDVSLAGRRAGMTEGTRSNRTQRQEPATPEREVHRMDDGTPRRLGHRRTWHHPEPATEGFGERGRAPSMRSRTAAPTGGTRCVHVNSAARSSPAAKPSAGPNKARQRSRICLVSLRKGTRHD